MTSGSDPAGDGAAKTAGDEVVIRFAGASDRDQVVALMQALDPGWTDWDPAILAARWRELMALPGAHVVVAETAGQLVSTCTLTVVPNLTRGGRSYAFIENVVTLPAHRRRGLARRVMEAALARALDAGCYKVMLLSGARNADAHAFYERLGFDRSKIGFQVRRL